MTSSKHCIARVMIVWSDREAISFNGKIKKINWALKDLNFLAQLDLAQVESQTHLFGHCRGARKHRKLPSCLTLGNIEQKIKIIELFL